MNILHKLIIVILFICSKLSMFEKYKYTDFPPIIIEFLCFYIVPFCSRNYLEISNPIRQFQHVKTTDKC